MKGLERLQSWGKALAHFFQGTAYCLRKAPGATLGALTLSILCKAVLPFMTWAQAEAIHIVSRQAGEFHVLWYFVIVLVLFILFAAYADMRGFVTLPLGKIIEGKVAFYCSKCVYKAISRTSLKELDREKTNTSIRRALERALDFQGDVMMCADVVGGVIALLVYWSVMVMYPWGICYLVLSILMAVAQRLFHLKYTEIDTEMKVRQASANRKADYFYKLQTDRDSVSGIKIDGVGDLLSEKWRIQRTTVMKEKFSTAKWWFQRSFVGGGLQAVLFASMTAFLAFGVMRGWLDIASFVYLTGAVTSSGLIIVQFIKSCEWFYGRGITIQEMNDWIVQGERIIQDELKKAEPEEDPKTNWPDFSCPAIELKNVNFSYLEGIPVLKDINLTLNQGEVIAVVGPNGGGKSTLMKVMLGLLEPDSGSVLCYGKQYAEITPEDRNLVLGAIFQDFVKFQFSLRDNVGFGYLPLLTDDKSAITAIEHGGAQGVWQQVNHNLDQSLGREFDEEGMDLSGGQWQRVAMSRSFMGEPHTIVFDEPASAIDPLSELQQFSDLKKYLEHKSGILVTHRVGLAKLADRVVYIEDGRIQETGTHGELMKRNGLYSALYQQQAKWYQWEE